MSYPADFVKRCKEAFPDLRPDSFAESFHKALDNGGAFAGRFLDDNRSHLSNDEILLATDLATLQEKARCYKKISDLYSEWWEIWQNK